MRLRMIFSALLLLPVLLLHPAGMLLSAEESGVVVIINSSNLLDKLSQKTIARLYSNYQLEWNKGESVILYDLTPSNPVRQFFSEHILDRDAYRVAERWAHMKITNQAINPPTTLKSEWMIMRRVSQQKNAIGYVSLRTFQANRDHAVKGIYLIQDN